MKYKVFARLLLGCMLMLTCLVAFSGCSADEGDIYFLNFKPEVASVYEDIARAYEKETGISLRVVTAASGTYEQTLKSEISKSSAPTIFQINGPKGYASWKNYCADLSDTEIYRHLTDKSSAISEGDAVYGIPYVVEGYGIIYNEEIKRKQLFLDNYEGKLRELLDKIAEKIFEDFISVFFDILDLERLDTFTAGVHFAGKMIKGIFSE